MREQRESHDRGERGSAMVIAILVVVILTLLGVSFLLMADTENRIAENEKLSAQALYFGESGVRMTKRWFDSPGSSSNLINATVSVIDRTLRWVDDDGDPSTAAHPQDGSTWPRYKQGVDLNADGADDLFDKPYRGGGTTDLARKNTLLGTEDHPDVRITESYSTAAKTFLTNLSTALMANFPAVGAGGLKARITTIDVYGPPYVNVAGTWTRYGMATVKATARIYKTVGTTDQILAERMVKAVLNETPYPGPFGPLHSCDELTFNGEFKTHWGATTAVGTGSVPSNFATKMAHSIPRAIPPTPRIDLLYGWNSPSQDVAWGSLKSTLEAGANIDDPWFRFIDRDSVSQWSALGTPQVYDPAGPNGDQSNLFQNVAGVSCPDFDYDTWKAIATSGGENVHYFSWDNGTSFKENGQGTAADFTTLTDNNAGLYFFDTKDGNPPSDTLDANGAPVNNTPEIKITSTDFVMKGFLYLNTVNFTSKGSPGRDITYTMPGEPFRDKNQDGVRNAGEDWINLNYNSLSSLTSQIKGSATDDFGNPGGGPAYNAAGPSFTEQAMLWGVLYVSGNFDAEGTPKYFGSVVSKTGIPNSAGTPDIYWDDSLRTNWPPPSWDLPRVIITRWDTDL
jgi:hypothetical protein